MSDVATISRELRTIRTSFRQLSVSFSMNAPALVRKAIALNSDNGLGEQNRGSCSRIRVHDSARLSAEFRAAARSDLGLESA